jgi:alkylation response protein AidB-like acyl-CoA dehydrogenase
MARLRLNADIMSEATMPADLDEVTEAAELAVATGDATTFFAVFRASDMPFLLNLHPPNAHVAVTIASLHAIGERSPGLAFGVSQHMAAMLAFGLADGMLRADASTARVVDTLLEEVFAKRLLVANTTSHAGGDKIGAPGSTITDTESGFVVSGYSTFLSLATEADKLIFLTRGRDGSPVGVVTDLVGNPALKVSDELLFGDHLVLADTRKVNFANLEVSRNSVIGADSQLDIFYLVQLACQNLCVASLYLGGAHRILEETRQFGLRTTLPTGAALATADSFSAALGRLAIEYLGAQHLLRAAAAIVLEIGAAALIEPSAARNRLLRISAVKHQVARVIEDIATECRKLVGTRAFMNGHPVARIGAEVVFAALGPATEKLIERNVGALYLKEI